MDREEYEFQKHYSRVNISQYRTFRLRRIDDGSPFTGQSMWVLNAAINATRKCLKWKPEQADLFGVIA